ncbi:MAG: DUF3783 domain-containing protein [Bacillota bacterium]|nr:DUF3783 domain-containing protein [Bacillota bacterium]
MSKTGKGIILLFHFEEGPQFDAVCKALFLTQITVRNVRREAYGMTIGQLADRQTPPKSNVLSSELDGQMIVFANLSEDELNRALALLRSNPACGKIPYKAIMTDNNKKWNAYELLAELKKEHAAMHAHS